MSEPTHIGDVFVWGLDGTLVYSGMSAAQNEPQGLSLSDDTSRHNSKSKKGETIGVQLYDQNPKITIRFFPKAAAPGAGAITLARAQVLLPAKGSKVTLAGFPPVLATPEDTINSVKWIYFGGGTIDPNQEGELVMSLPLEKFATDLATGNS